MAQQVASLYAEISARTDKLEAALAKAQAGLQKTTEQGNRLGTSLGDIAGAVGVPLTLGAIAAAGLSAGKAMIDLGMQMEQTKIAFTTLIGSAEGAQQHLDKLRDFAATTPFEFNDLTNASRKLQAFGFEAGAVVPMLTDIGDAVAAMGGNAAMIDRVTLAIGQMSAKGKVQAGEMLQMTEAGIPAWRYLAQAMGTTTAEVMKMSEKGLIPADKAIQAILSGMRQDFGGMMEEQANTATGAMSNLNDAMARLGTTLGEKANPAIRDASIALAKMVNSAAEMLQGSTDVQSAIAKGTITQEQYNQIVREAGHPAKALAEAMALVALNEGEADREARRLAGAQAEATTTATDLATAQTEVSTGLDTSAAVYREALLTLNDFNIGEAKRLELERELKLLSGELTAEDVEREKALGFLAKQMELGNITQAEYIRLVGELATGAKSAKQAIDEASEAIRNLPNRTVDITYRFSTSGSPPDPAAGDIGLPGGDSAPVVVNGGAGWGDEPAGPGGARGLDMIVPPGFPADTFPVRASSGERVTITPANQLNTNYGGVTINVNGAGNPVAVAQEVARQLRLAGQLAENRARM